MAWDVGGQRVMAVPWSRSSGGIVARSPAQRLVIGPRDELLTWEKVQRARWGPLAPLESCFEEGMSPGHAMVMCLKTALVVSTRDAVVVCPKDAIAVSLRVVVVVSPRVAVVVCPKGALVASLRVAVVVCPQGVLWYYVPKVF